MDALADLDIDLATLDNEFDVSRTTDGISTSFDDFDSFLTAFGDFFSGDLGSFDSFFDVRDEPFPEGFPNPDGRQQPEWMRYITQLDDNADGTIDQVVAWGVRHNDHGTFSIFGFTFGGSHPNAANINFCTGIDVISTVAGIPAGLGLLNALSFGNGLTIQTPNTPAGGGAAFAGGYLTLFFGSAGQACGGVGL